MQPDEATALGELAAGAVSGVAAQAQEVHAGIAGRVFDSLGPTASPVRVAHDLIAGGVYCAVRLTSGALARGAGAAVGATRRAGAPSLGDTRGGARALGALNGAVGDLLHDRASALETPMAVRRDGRDVALNAPALAAAFPDAGGRLAVFVHGLGETDEAWRRRAARHPPYAERLRAELGYTPIHVRYNSGLHISHNGRRLAVLLAELTANWPVEIAEISLIGHSMGGLVARSACHYAGPGSWREQVEHVFMLGAPHHGAPLELAVNGATAALSLFPETRGLARTLNARSAGVKDLRYGYLVDEDWEGHDPDALWHDTGTAIPFLREANHYFVSASLSRHPDHPVGRLFGDLLVRRGSAWSHRVRGGRVQFPVDRYRQVGAAHHFDLLNHPAVYEQIRRWISGGRELAPPQHGAD
ncbi:MAG: hypothetical protein ABSH51_17390 [Solirubrobacteraceae bacterium]|jgi:pimeloyl-ACP methyl ester carboxylesterase